MVADEGLEKAESSPQPTTATVPSEGGYTNRDFFLCQGAPSLPSSWDLGPQSSALAMYWATRIPQCFSTMLLYDVSESYVCRIYKNSSTKNCLTYNN